MKSKFQKLNFDSVAVLSKEQQRKVNGGAYGAGGSGGNGCELKWCSWNPPGDTLTHRVTAYCSVSGTGTAKNPCFYVCPGLSTCY